MTILDASFVFALLEEADTRHDEARCWYEGEHRTFATTPLVLVEIDYLLRTRSTPAALDAFHDEIRAGSLGVEWWPGLDARAAEVAQRHAGIGLSLTDASLVALAARLETNRIATFDERHFRAVEPLDGSGAFVLLPADA